MFDNEKYADNTDAEPNSASIGSEVFFVDSSGQSISWIPPPRVDPSSYAPHTESWFQKCNIYTVSGIREVYSMRSAKSQVVWDLIPEFGIDGHSRTPSTNIDCLVPVR